MDAVTRRRFLGASGVVGASALLAGAAGYGLSDLLKTASKEQPASRKIDKVVVVTLYGGNDGLNTVIPYADPAYHSARPELAYAPEKVLHLDGALGLNPVLRGLKALWDEKQVGIILGVGYPKPDRSHFRSMDIWQSASPAAPVPTGWIGRWLDVVGGPPEVAVSFEPVIPPLLVGKHRVGACISYGGLTLPHGISAGAVSALGRVEGGEPQMQAKAAVACADLITMAEVVREAEKIVDSSPAAGEESRTPATGTGGQNALATQLALVARCVEVGVPTRIYSVSLGGFDTHAEERDGQESLLRQLDSALSGFARRMAQTEAGRRVAVVVYSEFGRRVRANASDGTDHGTAGPVFVLGPRIVGGLYGEQPSLNDLDDGDLKATMDFRDVYASVLASVLQAEPARYLDSYQGQQLSLFPAD
jgi:uncharacterized protein (DUF1501 family)